jgi:PncC family amidohydrolase
MDLDTLARVVGELLRQRRLTLSVAESCTGGLLASQITDIPGSSDYFEGGIVAYSNSVKERILGVPRDTLEQHGAVSPQTAEAMASGARRLLQTDFALAITGIAGPGGAAADKPVGLVYLALSTPHGVKSRTCHWVGNRLQNRELSVREALKLLQVYLRASSQTGHD